MFKVWQGYGTAVREVSFDTDLPEKKLSSSDNIMKNALLGLVVAALLQLSSTADEIIQPEKVTKSVSKPTVDVYAYPGHHE